MEPANRILTACPKCGTALRAIRAGGRSAWYCPRHQRK
ncbi:MAG: zf-TFIIB domain-containing protein [Thiogranum sp.]|nr:zf-TFIIB domain-containing protein [Thiogranum sp.]